MASPFKNNIVLFYSILGGKTGNVAFTKNTVLIMLERFIYVFGIKLNAHLIDKISKELMLFSAKIT